MSAERELTAQNAQATQKRQKRAIRLGRMDLPFFIIVIILMTFGLVMMFSASYAWGYYESGDSFIYVRKQLLLAALGIVAMLVISVIDFNHLRRPIVVFGLFGMSIALLAMVLVLPSSGAKRWIDFGFVNFQPSEVAKLAIIILFAYLISVNQHRIKEFKYGVVPFLAALGLVAALVIAEPHLSGTIIICAIGIVMMFVGGVRMKHIMGIALVGIIALVLAVLALMYFKGTGYFMERIKGFVDPMSDPTDTTWQTYQSLITIGSGGVLGLGLGNSMQKYRFLPESHNDFVFAIVCEELGFVGAMLIIILFALFIFRGFYIASKAPNKFSMMVVVGITVQIGLQALLNIAVVTNSVPNTGISLPFFSYGGTALLMQLAEVGIVLNISRQSNLE